MIKLNEIKPEITLYIGDVDKGEIALKVGETVITSSSLTMFGIPTHTKELMLSIEVGLLCDGVKAFSELNK